jgi:hypothetical protein
MLKRTIVSERATARARQHGFDLQVEAITQRDADSRWALANARELYASVEAQASAVTKQEEDHVVRACQVNQWEREMEKLEGLLQERKELDDIILRRELKAPSTHETSLDHREANLEREQKALEDARAQILARELDADARDTGLRDQEARLAVQDRQLAERQMQELVVAQKGLEDYDRTTSELRGLSPNIISGDSRWSENAQTHTIKHTIPNMKFKLKLLKIKCHVLEFTQDKVQKVLQRIIRVFVEAFVSHDRHTLFALEESEPPRMTYTCGSQEETQLSSVWISHCQPSSASPEEGGRSSPAHR